MSCEISNTEAIDLLKAMLLDEELTRGARTKYGAALRKAINCINQYPPKQVNLHDGVESEVFP
jgi:hypothetical protein